MQEEEVEEGWMCSVCSGARGARVQRLLWRQSQSVQRLLWRQRRQPLLS